MIVDCIAFVFDFEQGLNLQVQTVVRKADTFQPEPPLLYCQPLHFHPSKPVEYSWVYWKPFEMPPPIPQVWIEYRDLNWGPRTFQYQPCQLHSIPTPVPEVNTSSLLLIGLLILFFLRRPLVR